MSLIKPNDTQQSSSVQVFCGDDVSSPEHSAGFAESLPVCGPRGGDSVACGGCERGATLLAAADGRGSAGRGNGCYSEVHPKCRVEMVTLSLHMQNINI